MRPLETPSDRPAEHWVWRPPASAWVALGLVAFALVAVLLPAKLEGRWEFATPLLIVLAVVALRRLWYVDPAIVFSAAVALTIFSGQWDQLGLARLPLDRLLAVFVVCQCLLRAPGTAAMPRLRLGGVHLLMALAILYAVGSAAAAGTLLTEAGFLSIWDELGFMPFLLFLVAPAVFHGSRERRFLLWTLTGVGAYLGLTAIFEILGPHSLVFPHYITLADASRPGVLRAGGPFASAIAEGAAGFACAVAATIAYGEYREDVKRWLIVPAGLLGLCACLLSLERSVWIAALLGIVAVSLLTRKGRRRLVPGLALGALAIGVALALSPALSNKASERASNEMSVHTRQDQLAAGWRMLNAKPLLGFGWDRYRDEALDYFRLSPDYALVGYVAGTYIGEPEGPQPLHNSYLSYAVELGLVGALLWLASLLWAVGKGVFDRGPAALRPWKLGLVAVAVFVLVVTFFNPHEPSFPILIMLVWAGVACAGARPRLRQGRPMRAAGALPPWTAEDAPA